MVGGRKAVGTALLAVVLVSFGAVGCKKSSSNPDAADGPIGEVGVGGDVRPGDGRDGPDAPVCTITGTAKANGDACCNNGQCTSGFCADGVCCNVACTEGCKTCAASGSEGTCVVRPSGAAPRDSTTCVTTPVSTCGLDGKCDGLGGCRKYPMNTICRPGMCEGDAVVGANACDGAGRCKPGATVICVPFSCNPSTGDCYKTCATSSQCTSGHQCVDGSCGTRMKGSPCEVNADCTSGFCADKICCNVACTGPCVSCNLMGREGTCWPVDVDQADPRGKCRDTGPSTCGQTGQCDGVGGCSLYARDTECLPASCSGNRLNTPGTCNGLGTCQPPGVQNCDPFRCVNKACTTTCTTNADCAAGIACVNNTCGPKQDGQPCKASSECQHNHCVDNVCCDQACAGACRSCSLGASLGRCTPIAAGTADPRMVCTAMAAATCGTNGKCDGNGGCQTWPMGTLCGDETCNPIGNVYKPPSTCNANGQCVAPDLQPCSPYICNGTRCFTSCTTNNQCVSPNSCTANSCGLKDLGASCSAASECRSNFCAQGVCCDSACNTACKSCIAGTLGVCSNVATNSPDPSGLCAIQDAATCGTNGKCEGGACQKWGSGTPCLPATCPTTSNLFTPLSACDGAGLCVTPGSASCFPYRCGTSACKATCTADADCLPPAVCNGGSCGLKPNGAICANKNECLSSFCEQGVCCETACTGICKSCALTASRGACTNLANGSADIMSRCSDQGAPSCGTDGFCDGRGACRLYGAGTSCAPPSCQSGQSTLVSGRTCNGLGVCQPATNIPCAPYVCNGATACLAACTRDGDCLPPNICDPQTSRCGNQKRLGQPCAANSECLTGNFCVDGVCCSTNSCALCKACNVGTSAGNCANIPAGTPDSMNRCTPNPPCGNTGACNGAGVCALASTTVTCAAATCSGSTYTPASHCNGTGGCAASTSSSCGSYTCGGDACRTNCAMDSHCVTPFTCQGTPPNRNCALKINGLMCTAGNQCISGACVDGVCCGLPSGSTSCGTCATCNGSAATAGTCTPLALGAAAPAGQCPASPPCGNTGLCNGASGCQQAAATVPCGLPVSCNGTTFQPASSCSGGGVCNQAATTSCGAYVCGTNACRTNCTSDAHCANSNLYCDGNGTRAGSCVPKKANGAACGAANECAVGNCTDGVCCTTASCSACQSCNVNGTGTCTNVANGSADPPNCAANGVCGNTGFCVSGACQQQPTSIGCGLAASCSGTTYQPPSFCSGTGTCNQTSTTGCGAYLCGATACRTSCTGDGDCAAGNYCSGTTCVPKKALGAACGAGNQCVSGNCTDGVCCSTPSCTTCMACNLNGQGTCSDVPINAPEPHLRCQSTGPCGNTGACSGNGACQQQPATLSCGTTVSCVGSTYQPQSFCSGGGSCNQMSPISCSPFVCNSAGSACLQSCNNNDADCVSGTYCTGGNGSCLSKKAPGVACSSNHECTTGNCVDGVCCNASVCGTCETCNGSSPGTCTTVPNNPPQAEPHGLCPANPPCGNTGFCKDGACAQGAQGTMCTGFFCPTASSFQPGGTCTGTGSCSVPSAVDCSPYTCTTGTCRATCSGDGDCVSGFYCNGVSCVAKKSLGDACGRNEECGSTHCTSEGVCCNVAGCPSCQSCKVPGLEGTCNNVPTGGGDPVGQCPTQDPSTCGTNGKCNGGGNCQLYEIGRVCTTSCVSPLFTTFTCDGLGSCILPQVETCPSLVCDANGCIPAI
jgi:hypothetical protein